LADLAISFSCGFHTGLTHKEGHKKNERLSVFKVSGKMKLATTFFVVAFDMRKTKKMPRTRRGKKSF